MHWALAKIGLTSDSATTLLGVVMAVLHQYGVVGNYPTTLQGWEMTGMSVVIAIFGYLTNKMPR